LGFEPEGRAAILTLEANFLLIKKKYKSQF